MATITILHYVVLYNNLSNKNIKMIFFLIQEFCDLFFLETFIFTFLFITRFFFPFLGIQDDLLLFSQSNILCHCQSFICFICIWNEQKSVIIMTNSVLLSFGSDWVDGWKYFGYVCWCNDIMIERMTYDGNITNISLLIIREYLWNENK